jgi:aconitate hydratase
MSIYDAAMRYEKAATPLVILAGKEYGTGSSRDWAAKGTMLLGVRAVIAESFERIHRSNLIGMGVLPLEFKNGQTAQSLGLTGREKFDIAGLQRGDARTVAVIATPAAGSPIRFEARVRIDTPKEREYFKNGGILHFVLRQLAKGTAAKARSAKPASKPKKAAKKRTTARAATVRRKPPKRSRPVARKASKKSRARPRRARKAK